MRGYAPIRTQSGWFAQTPVTDWCGTLAPEGAVIRHPLLAAYVQKAGKPKTEQDWLALLAYINTHE